jgi:hypothetical protein
MFRSSLMMGALLLAACGMEQPADVEAAGADSDPLLRSQGLQRLPFTDTDMIRSERCSDEIILPTVTATIREMVQLRTREVATDLGPVVQSWYHNTTGDNEEIRKGVAEFKVSGDIKRAVLHFKEAREVAPLQVAPDTHGIWAYPADFKATVDDFADPATEVARFETDNNLPPRDGSGDVTAAVQLRQPNVGFRFELEALPGNGAEFDSVELVVTRCVHMTTWQ